MDKLVKIKMQRNNIFEKLLTKKSIQFWDEPVSDEVNLLEKKFSMPVINNLTYLSADDLKKIPKQELYRLIVDGQFHKKENGWLKYAKREPNSLSACFNALQLALSTINHHPNLSIKLIKEVHQAATINVARLNPHTKPGEFRLHQGGFLLIQGAYPFISQNGFIQLFEKVNKEYIDYGACISAISQAEAVSLNSTTFYNQVLSLKNSIESADKLWGKISEFFAQDILFYRAPDSSNLEFLLENICEEYNLNIHKAIGLEEKLNIITETIQNIEQLHPFPDANGRTSLIILQRLLIQNNFYPAMLYNPNYIDGYHISELIIEIKKGIQNTTLIIQHPELAIYNYQTQFFLQSNEKNNDQFFNKIIDNYYFAENDIYQYLQSIKFTSIFKLK